MCEACGIYRKRCAIILLINMFCCNIAVENKDCCLRSV
nr:MAG TPA: hypothetical protein [Caudoviricetes sp.]